MKFSRTFSRTSQTNQYRKLEHYQYDKSNYGAVQFTESCSLEFKSRSPRTVYGKENRLSIVAQVCKRGNVDQVKRLLKNSSPDITTVYKPWRATYFVPKSTYRARSGDIGSNVLTSETSHEIKCGHARAGYWARGEDATASDSEDDSGDEQRPQGSPDAPDAPRPPRPLMRDNSGDPEYAMSLLQLATQMYYTLPEDDPKGNRYLAIIRAIIAQGGNLYQGTITRDPYSERPKFVMVNPSPYYLIQMHVKRGRFEMSEAVTEAAQELGEHIQKAQPSLAIVSDVMQIILVFLLGPMAEDAWDL